MTRLPDDRRQPLADDIADRANVTANMLGPALRRLTELAGSDINAASLNGSGGGHEIPRPTERAALAGHTPELAAPTVRAHHARVDGLLVQADSILRELEQTLGRYTPRLPTIAQWERAELEEANRDPGCESHARIVTGGARVYRATWRTGRVAGKAPKTETKKGTKSGERRRERPFLAGDSTDRLDVERRLCRGCYEHVLRNIAPGSSVPLAQAIPTRLVREWLTKTAA